MTSNDRITDLRALGGAQVEQPTPLTFPDGIAYDIMMPHEFGLTGRARINRLISELNTSTDDPEADAERQQQVLNDLVAMAYPSVPAEVVAALNEDQLIYVVSDFLALLLGKKAFAMSPATQASMARVESLMQQRQATSPTT